MLSRKRVLFRALYERVQLRGSSFLTEFKATKLFCWSSICLSEEMFFCIERPLRRETVGRKFASLQRGL